MQMRARGGALELGFDHTMHGGVRLRDDHGSAPDVSLAYGVTNARPASRTELALTRLGAEPANESTQGWPIRHFGKRQSIMFPIRF
jgi:hypothetical protein